MGLTDKTRKTLWAKSGNRCLLCRIELVQQQEDIIGNVIIGEECHIISASNSGPRGNADYNGDFDGYNNMLLLCANDHKKIDELTNFYTVEKLILLKLNHEIWVKKTLENDVLAFANDRLNVKSLPKIKSGKQLVDIINGAHMFDFNHEELKTEQEANEIGGLFENLRDTGDILSDIGYLGVAKFGIELNDEMEKLKQSGFLLFGMKRNVRLNNDKKEDMGVVEFASLVAVRDDNPCIIDDFLIAKFPKNIRLSF